MTKTGYTFDGWYQKADFSGSKWDFDNNTVTGNIILHAKWNQNQLNTFTVTFRAGGGTPQPADQNVVQGGKVAVPPAMTRTGYTFGGWLIGDSSDVLWNFETNTVTSNIALFASWTPNTYTVTYNKNASDAVGAIDNGTAVYGKNFTLAVNKYTRIGYEFDGWYENAAGTGSAVTQVNPWTLTQNKTYYAKWKIFYALSSGATRTPVTAAGSTFTSAWTWLGSNAASNGEYYIVLQADTTSGPKTINSASMNGKSGIKLTIEGINNDERKLTLSSNGSLFTVASGYTLTLQNGGTLKGKDANTDALITVSGGTLNIKTGGRITENSRTGNTGSGVYMANGAINISGGSIDHNILSNSGVIYGGGLCVDAGDLTMTGGAISYNSAVGDAYGGGASLRNSAKMTMSGGIISYNTAGHSAGGLHLKSNAQITMSGGEISNNTATIGGGGGLRLRENAQMTMSGGEISNNNAGNGGGGVHLIGPGTLQMTMTGGRIVNNTAHDGSTVGTGGGVQLDYGAKLTVRSGTITGNKALGTNEEGGGGICVYTGVLIFQSGGTIVFNSNISASTLDADSRNSYNLRVMRREGTTLTGIVYAYSGANRTGGFVWED
jgi:uncharacterized repeat protein (TIGR02543 family)